MRLFAAAVLVAAAAEPMHAQQAGPPSRLPEITVSAQGEARVTPDRATVVLGVQSRGSTASAAARENAVLQRGVIDTLLRMGLESSQLTTNNFAVRPDYRPGSDQTPSIAGYVVSNAVQVILRDLSQVSQVIDAALGKGANAVHGLQFHLADVAPAREAAMLDAIAKARADAEILARGAGGRLGPILEMTTVPMNDIRVYQRSGVASGTITPVEPGQTTVTAVVTIRYALITGR